MTFSSVVYADVHKGWWKVVRRYATITIKPVAPLSAAAVEIAHFCLQDGRPLPNIQDIILKGSLARWPTFAKYISRLFYLKLVFIPILIIFDSCLRSRMAYLTRQKGLNHAVVHYS